MRSQRIIVVIAGLLLAAISLSSSGRPGIPNSIAPAVEGASQDPIASLQALQPPAARAQVLVLATFHLRQIQKEFKPAMLDRLIAELLAFRPDAVCIESLPGPAGWGSKPSNLSTISRTSRPTPVSSPTSRRSSRGTRFLSPL